MGEAEFGGERLPGAPDAARAVRLRRQGVQHIEQPIRGVRQGKAFRTRPLGNEPRREMGCNTPGEIQIGHGRTAEVCDAVDRDEAGGGADRVAVVMAFEKACLGKRIARLRSMKDEPASLRGEADKLQRPLAHEDEPKRGIARPEQCLAARQAPVSARRQGQRQIVIHMIPVIAARSRSALPIVV